MRRLAVVANKPELKEPLGVSTNSNAPNRPHMFKSCSLFGTSCVLKVVHTAPKPTFSSFKQLGHTCQEFGTTTAVLTPGHTQIPRFLSAKLSRRVTELRTRFSGKRRILCSSLAVASPAFRADQQNSKITQLWIHMNPWCFWYFLLLWNPSNPQGTTVWSAWSWRIHSRNTGLVSFCWHNCKLNAARQLQRNCN